MKNKKIDEYVREMEIRGLNLTDFQMGVVKNLLTIAYLEGACDALGEDLERWRGGKSEK